jgi:hypothetical protein
MQIKNIAMKKSILLFILVSLFTCSFAVKPVVTVDDAKRTAANFLTEQCYINAASIRLTLQHTETDENGEPLFYRFQLNDRGFVIVSATELYYPVVAFSYESNYAAGVENDAFCASYKKSIEEAKTAQVPVSEGATKAWNHFNTKNFTKSKAASAHECQPLLTTSWGQKKYYNQYCPFDGHADESSLDSRTTVGNAALAMASIINYYRFPTHGSGGVSYISYIDRGAYQETYPRIFLNLNNVTYNYDAMTSTIDGYNGEVAKLLYHTGATALTNYSAERTVSDKTQTEPVNAFNALKQYWGFSTEAQMTFRPTEIQNDSIWISEYVIPDLDERHPVFYSAYSDKAQLNNMCMVVDGYKYMTNAQGASSVFLHVNLAPTVSSADEMKKAYYMYPSRNFLYRFGESVIRFLHPIDEEIEEPVVSESEITAKAGTISDGAGNMKYQSNSNRQWLIEAPNANKYTFTFKRLNTEADNDVVSIYAGEEADPANLIRSYSGQHLTVAATDHTEGYNQQVTFDMPALPDPLTVTSDKVLVTFTSNDTIEDYGFVLEYSSTYDQSAISTCAPSKTLTNFHYVLTDKSETYVADDDENVDEIINSIVSEDEPYAANTTCSWTIKTNNAIGYYIYFPKFDLKAGDVIEITTTGSTPELLYKFDVYNWPVLDGYTVDASKMKIRFVTDHWQEGNGFELGYWANTGINQESGLSDVNVYPNPATSFLNVDLTADAQNIKVNVVDMSGKILYNDMINHDGGNQIYKVPVSNLASGIYYLQLNTPTGKSIQKFIVR